MDEVKEALEAAVRLPGYDAFCGQPEQTERQFRREIVSARRLILKFLENVDDGLSVMEVREAIQDYEAQS